MIRLLTWGPRNGPQPPNARRAPAEPGRASIIVAGDRGPETAPNPPTLVAPRETRGALRSTPTLVPARQSRAAPRRSSVLLAHVERLDRLHVGGVQQRGRAGPAVGRGPHGDRAAWTDCGSALQTAEPM